jgi:hypothetical protein
MTADDEDFPGKTGSPSSPNHYHQRVIRLLSADSMISDLTISASEANAPLLTPRHSFRMSAMERRMNKGGPGGLGTGIGGGDKLTPTTEVKSIQRLSLRQQRQFEAINQRATGNVQDGNQRGRSADRGGMMSRSMRSKSPASTGTGFSSEARGRTGFAFGRAMDNNSQTRGRSKTPVEDNLNSKYNSRYPNYLREGRSKSPSVTSRYNRGVTRSHSPTMMSRGRSSSGMNHNRSSKSPAPTRSRSAGGGRTTATRASSVPASATSSRGSSFSPSKTSYATARFFNSRTPAVSRSGRFNNNSYTTRTTTTTTMTTRTTRTRSKSPAISERLERLSTPKGFSSPPANLKIPPRRSSSTPPADNRKRSSSAGPRTTTGIKEKSPKIREELHLPPSSTRRSVHDLTISTINRVRSHSSPRPASKTLVSPQSSASSSSSVITTPGGGGSLVIDALGSKASLINHFSQNQKSPAAATMTAVLSPPSASSSARRLAQEAKEKSKFSPPPQQQKNSMNTKSFPSTVKSPQGTGQQQTTMRSPPPSPAVSSSSSAARPTSLQRSKTPPAAIANSRPIPFSNSSRSPLPSYMSPLQKNSPAAAATTTTSKGSVSNLYKNSTEKRVSSANWYADNYNSTAVEKNLLSPTTQQQQQRGGRERSNSRSSVRSSGRTPTSSGRSSSATRQANQSSSSRPNSRPSSMRQTTTIMYPDEPDEVRTSWTGRGSISSSPNKANMNRPSYQITTEGTIPDDSELMEEMRNLSPQRANVINSQLTSSELRGGDTFETDHQEEDDEEKEATVHNSHGSYIDDIVMDHKVKDISIIERNESIDYQLSIDLNEDDSEEDEGEEEKGPEQLQNIRKGLVASLDHEKATKYASTTFNKSTTVTMTEIHSPMKDLNTLEKSNQKIEKADSEKKINEFISPALGKSKSKSNDSLRSSNSFKETSVVNLFEEVEDDGMLSPTGNFLSRSHSSEKVRIINTHLTTAELKRLSSSGSLDENDAIPISLSLNGEVSSNLNELAEIEAQQKRIAARLSSQGYDAGSSAFSPSSASPSAKQQLSEIEKISFSPMIRRTPTTEKMEILNTPLTTEELKSLSGDQNDLSSSLKKKLSRTVSREDIIIVEQPSFERPKSWKSPPKPSTAKEPEGIVPESQTAIHKKSYEFSAATSPLASPQKPPRPTSVTDRKEKKFFEAENNHNVLETNEMTMISSPKRSVPSSPVSRRNSNASPSGNHISEMNVTRIVTESSTTTHHQNKAETTHKEKNLKFTEHASEYSMADTSHTPTHDQQPADNTPPAPVAVVLTDVPPIEDEETFLKLFLLSKMVTLTTTTTTKMTTTTSASTSRPTSYKKESASTNNKIISPTAGNKQEKDQGEYVSSNTSVNSAHSSNTANTKETASTTPVKTIKRKREIFMPSLKHTSQKIIDTVYKVVKMKEESKNAMFNIQALLSKSSSMDFDDADYYQSPEEFLKSNRTGSSFRSPPNSKGNHLSSHHFHYPAENNSNNAIPSPSRNSSSNQAEGGASSKQTFYGYKRQLSVRNIEKLLSLTNYTFSPEGGRPSAEKLEMSKPSFKAQNQQTTGNTNGRQGEEEDGDDKSRVSHNSEFTYSTIKTTATHLESANTDNNNNSNKPLELYTTDELIAEMNKIADFRLHQEENPQEEYNDDSDEEDVHALHADDLGEMVPLGKLSNQIPFTSTDVQGKGTTAVDHDDDSRRFTMSLV